MVNTGYALQEMQRYRNQSEGNAESYQWYRRGREGRSSVERMSTVFRWELGFL
jgi:hypothetical protein